MTGVVASAALGRAWAHGQQRLRRSSACNLRFLVHAQDDCTLRRIEVEPDNVAHLLDKQRISRELEGLLPVRLKGEGIPDAPHRVLCQPEFLRQGARRPVGRTSWLRLQRTGDDFVTCSSLSVRGGPGRRSSVSPSSR